MTAPYQVNLSIEAGTDFKQEFYLTNPDMSPMNITGYTFTARLAKHPTAIDAVVSTSGNPAYAYTDLTAAVVNGPKGIYSIALAKGDTSKLPEGKYLYNVVMTNTDAVTVSVLSGIAFIDVAFGSGSFVLPT